MSGLLFALKIIGIVIGIAAAFGFITILACLAIAAGNSDGDR